MKTITEFSGFTLKEAMAKKAALVAEGKTEEEAQTAINEQLKLADDTKIAFYKNAVDMTSSRIERVKRVVVALKGSETEKVPESFAEREGHFYLVEYFPTQDGRSAQGRGRDDDRFDRGGRGKGRGGREGGRGGRDGGRDSRPENRGGRSAGGRGGDDRRPRADSPRGEFQRRDPSAPRDPNAPAPEKRAPRPPRQPRVPKGPRPQGPKGAGELRLVLKGQSTTLPGSAPTAPAATEASAAPATPVTD